MLSKYYWRTLKLNLKWVKFWSRPLGLGVHICKNLSTGNCPCFVSQGEPQLKRLFQFQFQNESNFDIFADSLVWACSSLARSAARVVSIFCNSTICPPPSHSFLEREHLSNFCNLSSSRCNFRILSVAISPNPHLPLYEVWWLAKIAELEVEWMQQI